MSHRFIAPLFSAVVLFAAAVARAAGPQEIARQMLSSDAILARTERLELTAAQRATLADIAATQRAAVATNQTAIRRATDELVALLAAARPDEPQVLAKFDELAAAENALKRTRLRTTVRLKNLLTAEQLDRLDAPAAETRAPGARPTAGADAHLSIPEMLQQVRAGIARWRDEGRDLTRVNALWDRFRRHAEAREHPEARRTLQELLTLLSAPPDAD